MDQRRKKYFQKAPPPPPLSLTVTVEEAGSNQILQGPGGSEPLRATAMSTAEIWSCNNHYFIGKRR